MTAQSDNVLYVMAEQSLLCKEGETVVVKVEGERKLQVPFLHLSSVVVIGAVRVTPDLMGALCEAGVSVSFFSVNVRFIARVEGPGSGSVLLRRAQFRAADDRDKKMSVARSFVIGKVANARRQLRRAARDGGAGAQELEAAADRLAQLGDAASREPDIDALRGLEGAAAAAYFGVFGQLVKRADSTWEFGGRSRRPPRDAVNALLSFGYAMLLGDCVSALAGVGLDPSVGFLHEDRPGRPGLALDLMEELRVPVVDRLCLALINRSQLSPSDFRTDDAGGVLLTDAGRKTFLGAYQKAKQAEIRHEFLDQQVSWGRVPLLQARLLARMLRSDLDVYPPFATH